MKKVVIFFIIVTVVMVSISANDSEAIFVENWDFSRLPEVEVSFRLEVDNSAIFKGSDFKGYLDGVELENVSVSKRFEGEGVSIVFLLDCSSSMKKNDAFLKAVACIKDFIGWLSENDKVGIVFFGEDVQTYPLNENKTYIENLLDSRQADERYTALNRALFEASDLFAEADSDSSVVIVLTDGKNTEESVLSEVMLEHIRSQPVKLYTVGIGNEVDRTVLYEIASLSAGMSFFTEDATDLSGIYETIASKLDLVYTLKLNIAICPDDGWHQIMFTAGDSVSESVEKYFFNSRKSMINVSGSGAYKKIPLNTISKSSTNFFNRKIMIEGTISSPSVLDDGKYYSHILTDGSGNSIELISQKLIPDGTEGTFKAIVSVDKKTMLPVLFLSPGFSFSGTHYLFMALMFLCIILLLLIIRTRRS